MIMLGGHATPTTAEGSFIASESSSYGLAVTVTKQGGAGQDRTTQLTVSRALPLFVMTCLKFDIPVIGLRADREVV